MSSTSYTHSSWRTVESCRAQESFTDRLRAEKLKLSSTYSTCKKKNNKTYLASVEYRVHQVTSLKTAGVAKHGLNSRGVTKFPWCVRKSRHTGSKARFPIGCVPRFSLSLSQSRITSGTSQTLTEILFNKH